MAKSISRYIKAAEEVLNGKITFSWNSAPVKAVPADWIRVASALEINDSDPMIRNLLLNAFISAESRYIGSSIGMMFEFDLNNNKPILNNRIEISELEKGLKSFIGDGLCFESTMRIFEQIGHESNIGFSVSNNNSKIIIKSKNAIKIPGNIADSFNLNISKLTGASVVAINGAVESISELQSIMNAASEINKNVIILASSFDGDVIKTLEHNWKSGKFKILPFKTDTFWSNNDVKKLIDLEIIPIDLENFMELRTINAEKLNNSNINIIFDDDGIQIENESGEYRLTEMIIPKHLNNMAGLIEDRILNGIAYCRLASMTGLQTIKNKNLFLPVISYNNSKKVNFVLQNNLNNLGLILEID